MGKWIKHVAGALVAFLAIGALLAGCSSEADTASENLSTAADNFEVNRRIVFFNEITDTYLLEIQGRCSIEYDGSDSQLEVTCKSGRYSYKKHFLGLSDNVTYFVEQIGAAEVSGFHYKVNFLPEVIVPDIDLQTSSSNQSEPGDSEQPGG